mmetsp:Transcript_22594/g.42581  ORF Transcript_22594/g.42581 Transcript_22594/m.42581 type:complete len:292 (-) Transcript_22594:67-942(-)
MQKSRSLPRLEGPQKFPKIRVVHHLDPAHIALREKRLGMRLVERKDTGPKTPAEVFAAIDDMWTQRTRSGTVQERRDLLAQYMASTLDVAERGKETGTQMQQEVPQPVITIPSDPAEVFQSLDTYATNSSPRTTVEALDECSLQMAQLLEEVAKTDGVLQRDLDVLEDGQVDEKVVEETPAEVVARDPGPALLAARQVPSLFREIDAHLPRSKRRAYETLRSAGAVDIHRYIEENFEGALERRDDGVQWAHKVLFRKDRHPGQATWTRKALQMLDAEREERRLGLGLGGEY